MARQTSTYGKLRLHYTHAGNPHTLSVNITSALDPTDSGACQTAADDLAGALADICPTSVAFTDWDTLDIYGAVLNSGALTAAVPGVNAGDGPDWLSFTISFTGKESYAGADGKRGNTELRVFTGSAIQAAPGQKAFTGADDLGINTVANFLATDARFWAGFHGIKATVRAESPIQWNAHAQRHLGS